MVDVAKVCKYVKKGQYGRLYILTGHHARGKTLHIYVLPPDTIIKNHRLKGAVEVFGIVSGQPGWTEKYGWLKCGKWCEDFEEIFNVAKADYEKKRSERIESREKLKTVKEDSNKKTLESY
jgi:hypothetical protein